MSTLYMFLMMIYYYRFDSLNKFFVDTSFNLGPKHFWVEVGGIF